MVARGGADTPGCAAAGRGSAPAGLWHRLGTKRCTLGFFIDQLGEQLGEVQDPVS